MSVTKVSLSPVEPSDVLSFSGLLSAINRVDQRNKKHVHGKDIVLVIGNTGAGKSTFVNYAIGRRFFPDPKTVLGSTTYSCVDPVMKIGSDPLRSETSEFSTFHDCNSRLTYCDCPGFMDSRGASTDIANAYALQQISSECSSIKGIVVMVNYHSLQADRGRSLQDLAVSVQGIVGDKFGLAEYSSSLLILFTRLPADVTLHDLRANMAACEALPFGADVLSKVNIYDILDRRADAMNRGEIVRTMQSFSSFPAGYLCNHLSASSQVAMSAVLSAETSSIFRQFSDTTLDTDIHTRRKKYSTVRSRIVGAHRLSVLKQYVVDEQLTRLLQDLSSAVCGMAGQESNLLDVQAIQDSIPELADIAASTVAAIQAGVCAREEIERREQAARYEQQRQRDLAEVLRQQTVRAEQERREVEAARNRERERDSERERQRRRCADGYHDDCRIGKRIWTCNSCGKTGLGGHG